MNNLQRLMRILSIFSLLLLLFPILSANVCIIVYLDLLCAGSTHLHGIRADRFLSKSYTKLFLWVLKIEDTERWNLCFTHRQYFSRLITIWNGS